MSETPSRPPSPELTCRNCGWWAEWNVQPRQSPDRAAQILGECRRHSPVIVGSHRDTTRAEHHTRWPSTRSHDWCGSFKAAVPAHTNPQYR